MPVIGAINTCTNGSLKDSTAPSNVTVNRAEWGDLVQARTSSRTIDPLVLEVSGLQAGNELLFINVDDPKVKAAVKAGKLAALPKDAIKPYALPDADLQGLQNLELTDKAAMELGLTKGCEFALLQRDKAGNVSAAPAFVELSNKGDTMPMWQRPAGTHIGDANIATPAYSFRVNGYNSSSSDYNFVRGRDGTAATTYLSDIKIFLDEKTGAATLTADQAVTGKSTIRLKNLTNQKTFEAKDAEGDGNVKLEGIELSPGDRYSLWVIDRNGVEEKVVDATFMPANCGCGSALNVQMQNMTAANP